MFYSRSRSPSLFVSLSETSHSCREMERQRPKEGEGTRVLSVYLPLNLCLALLVSLFLFILFSFSMCFSPTLSFAYPLLSWLLFGSLAPFFFVHTRSPPRHHLRNSVSYPSTLLKPNSAWPTTAGAFRHDPWLRRRAHKAYVRGKGLPLRFPPLVQ